MFAETVSKLVLKTPPSLIEHPAKLYLSTLAPGSEPTMKHSLNLIAQMLTDGVADYLTFNWSALRYKHTAAIRAALIKQYEPATVNRILCALRRVLKEALRLELMTPQDYARAVDVESVKASKELKGRALTQEEINALMSVCFGDRTPAGFRDAALIAILRGAGLRRAEVVNLNLADFDPTSGAIKIYSGKGRIDRTVYLPQQGTRIVEDWLDIRNSVPGSLLCHVNKAGRIVIERLSPSAVLFILNKRGKEAGVEDFSPHDLRRTFASDLLDAGVDISTVQKLMGHKNIAGTVLYDRRGEETKCTAVQVLSIPERLSVDDGVRAISKTFL